MKRVGSHRAFARTAAARLLAAFLLVFAQITGAALSGASLAAPGPLELCSGTGELRLAGQADERSPAEHRHELCPCCLACPGKSPVPTLAAVPRPGPVVRAEARRPAREATPPRLARTIRPPGRAPPALS